MKQSELEGLRALYDGVHRRKAARFAEEVRNVLDGWFECDHGGYDDPTSEFDAHVRVTDDLQVSLFGLTVLECDLDDEGDWVMSVSVGDGCGKGWWGLHNAADVMALAERLLEADQ